MKRNLLVALFTIALSNFNHSHAQTSKTVFYQCVNWSRNNKMICFQALVLDSGKYVPGKWELYTMKRNGKKIKRITTNNFDDRWPSLSPDGKKIVFQSNRDGNEELYIMNTDGSQVHRLTHDPGNDAKPQWSPDGSKIVFVSNRGGTSQLYAINADGGNLIQLPTNLPGSLSLECPQWSNDGSKIVYYTDRKDGRDQVYVLQLGQLKNIKITNDTLNNIYPSFMSDDNHVIYSSGDIIKTSNVQEASTEKINLVEKYFFSSCSHDGKEILLIGGGRFPSSGLYRYYLANKKIVRLDIDKKVTALNN